MDWRKICFWGNSVGKESPLRLNHSSLNPEAKICFLTLLDGAA
jgi:hypothetical protein